MAANVEAHSYKDDNTGASDLEIDPKNPDTIFAGLWESRLGPFEDSNEFAGHRRRLFKIDRRRRDVETTEERVAKHLAQIDVAIAAE